MGEINLKGEFNAELSQFAMAESGTPSVGVCLSGGGSRALVAGMGQLRALKYLNLLGKTKAISTVSGGSWVGSTFEYIKSDVSDDEYLNKYVADQEKLIPSAKGDTPPEQVLDSLPEKNIAKQISQDFDMLYLAVEVFWLCYYDKVDLSMIWQIIIGKRILEPYGLYCAGKKQAPTTTFTHDVKTRDAIVADNPGLDREKIHMFADVIDPDKTKRPYLICNSAMFVKADGSDYSYLVPVQATPFCTGIPSCPEAVDANKKPVGGGGVTSFAFSSTLEKVNGSGVTITQDRQCSLADMIGTSSAFFAGILQNMFAKWLEKPEQFIGDLKTLGEDKIKSIKSRYAHEKDENIFERIYDTVKDDIEDAAIESFEELLTPLDIYYKDFLDTLKSLQDIIPEYRYWPVKGAAPESNIKATRFADGGNLENTGINGLLSYPEIDRVIAFVNSETPLSGNTKKGVFDQDGKEIPHTRIRIDDQIPPLFGYQSHSEEKGYRLLDQNEQNEYKYSQVFESVKFSEFLRNMATATGENCNTHCAMVKISLRVMENKWFGVKARDSVELLLVYMNRTRQWYDKLSPDVLEILGDFNAPDAYSSFPHYSTVTKTELSPTEINLLANFTAWNVAGKENAGLFREMYS
jgi:hypothetical protein